MSRAPLRRREVLRGALAGGAALLISPLACRSTPPRERAFAPPLGVTRGVGDGWLARSAGLDFLEVRVSGDLVPGGSIEEFAPHRDALLASPLPPRAANSFLGGHLRCTGPEADHDAVVAWCQVAFPRAEAVGLHTITFGSSAARSLPEGWPEPDGEAQVVELLGRLGPLAADHGVSIGLEPLQASESNLFNTLAQCTRVARAVDHAAVGVTADIFHMLRADEGPEAIRDAGDLVVHVHLAEQAERTPPGTDGDDFTGYLAALGDVGFGGGLSIECRWIDLEAELAPAVAALRAQVEGVSVSRG